MQLLTRSEAAKRLDMSTRTLDRLAKSGKIGRYYLSPGIVRFSVDELDEYKAGCRTVAVESIKQRKKAAKRPKVNQGWKPGEKLV